MFLATNSIWLDFIAALICRLDIIGEEPCRIHGAPSPLGAGGVASARMSAPHHQHLCTTFLFDGVEKRRRIDFIEPAFYCATLGAPGLFSGHIPIGHAAGGILGGIVANAKAMLANCAPGTTKA